MFITLHVLNDNHYRKRTYDETYIRPNKISRITKTQRKIGDSHPVTEIFVDGLFVYVTETAEEIIRLIKH